MSFWKILALGSVSMVLGMVEVAPAEAALMRAEFTGLVTDSSDPNGLLGPVGGSLDGVPFTLTFVYDTADHYVFTIGSPDPFFFEISGGTVLPARLQIGTWTQSVSSSLGSLYALWGLEPNAQWSTYYAEVKEHREGPGTTLFSTVGAGISWTGRPPIKAMDTPFSVTLDGGANGISATGRYLFEYLDTNVSQTWFQASGNLAVETLTVSRIDPAVTPVPLPTSAALLLGAVAALGGRGLSRRAST